MGQQRRGRSRTRRGVSRSWSPPNPRLDRNLSPDSRDVVHHRRRDDRERRTPAPAARRTPRRVRSPSPLTNASSFANTTVGDTTVGDTETGSSSEEDRKRGRKKKKNVNFANRKHQNAMIASKIEDAATEQAKALNSLAKRLSVCAFDLSSDSSDSSSNSSYSRHKKKREKSKKKRRPVRKQPDFSEDDSDYSGGKELVRRAHGARKPSQKNHSRRSVQKQQDRSVRNVGVPQRHDRSAQSKIRHRETREMSDSARHREAREMSDESFSGAGQSLGAPSVHGRNLGRYGRKVQAHKPNIAMSINLVLPPGPLGINVTSSERGPLVSAVSRSCSIRGLLDGDILSKLDGRNLIGLSAPEVISLFRATRRKERIVTVIRSPAIQRSQHRHSGIV